MKKIGIFCAALLAIGFTACDDTSDLGIAQVNAPEPAMQANGIGISYDGGFNTGSIDLKGEEGKMIDVLTWNVVQDNYDLPEDFTPEFRLRISPEKKPANELKLSLAASEADPHKIVISSDELSNAVITLYGREPVSRAVNIAIESYIVNGTQLVLLSRDLGVKTINVAPMMDPAYEVIEPAYYFMDNLKGMSLDKAVKMGHSDKHQYDDPVFTYILDVTEDDLTALGGKVEWKIIPLSAYDSQDPSGFLGVDANTTDDTLKGDLVAGGKAGVLTAAAKYLISYNALTGTYSIQYAADILYVWTTKGQFNKASTLTTSDNVHFSGAAILLGNWKLTAEKNFKGLQFGTSASLEAGQLLAGNKGAPIMIETPHLSWMNVDLGSLTYTASTVKTLGLIGNMTGWGDLENGGKADIELTPNADLNIWTATVTFPENGVFKIRSNNNWDDGFNLGGNLDDLSYDGADLTCEPGTYDVTLTIGYDHVYTLKMVKK